MSKLWSIWCMNTNMSSNATQIDKKTAVFLMAHGAPLKLKNIPDYLDNIRYGLSTLEKVVNEITERYEAIGGSSPLLDITNQQARALEKFLNQGGGPELKVYFGMRNWLPYIRHVVKKMKYDGVERVMALCLAPHYSQWSTERYFTALREGMEENDAKFDVTYLNGFYNHPLLIDAFVERYQSAIQKLKEAGEEDVHTIFTVHSIPAEAIDEGDPYAEQYTHTLNAIVDRVKPYRWYQAYQSQGAIPVPWLRPSVEETLDRIARIGSKPVLIFPIGFVSDHIEILYDIDIGFKEYAEARKLRLYRTETLNLSPSFIEALGAVIWEHLI